MNRLGAFLVLLISLLSCASNAAKKDSFGQAETPPKATPPKATPAEVEDNVFRLAEEGRIADAKSVASKSGVSGDDLVRLEGILNHAVGQADPALAALKKAFDAQPSDPRIAILLAETLCWKKSFRDAKAIVNDTKNDDLFAGPRPWELPMHKAAILGWLKDFAGMEWLLDRVQALPGLPERVRLTARVRGAELQSWRKNFPQALSQLDSVLAEQPGHVNASLVKGQVQEWQGRYRDAKATYAQALQAHPNDAQLRYRLEKLSWVK